MPKTVSRATQIKENTLEDKDGDTLVQVEESTDEDKIRFDTAGTQRMIIDETGQVGVGTDAPEEQFHIHGSNATLRLGNGVNSGEHSPKIQLSEMADSNGDMAYGFSVGYNGSTNNFELRRYSGNTAGSDVLIASRNSGDIGIKTTSPEADLHVYGGNSGQTFSNVTFAAENAGSSDAFYVFQTATAGGGKSFSITNGGKVGIGTTSPSVKLDVVSEASGETQVRLEQNNSDADAPDMRFFKSRGTTASKTAVADNDNLAYVNSFAYDGTEYQQAGAFGWNADGTDGDSTFSLKTRVAGSTADRLTVDPAGDLAVPGSVFVSGSIKTENDISFVDENGTFPTNTAGFYWDLNNDEARIYAKQPASDQIDFVFKLSDNNGSSDRYMYWIDDYRGGSYDRYPLLMHGGEVLFHMTEASEGVPDGSTSKVRIDSSGRIGMKATSDPSTSTNYAHIYAKDVSSSAEVFVRDEAGNVTQISPHNKEGEWQYFSRNTRTGKVVRVNMEKMIRKLEEITGESFMEEWYEDVD